MDHGDMDHGGDGSTGCTMSMIVSFIDFNGNKQQQVAICTSKATTKQLSLCKLKWNTEIFVCFLFSFTVDIAKLFYFDGGQFNHWKHSFSLQLVCLSLQLCTKV